MRTRRKLLALATFMLFSFLLAARLLAAEEEPGAYQCSMGWTGRLTILTEGSSVKTSSVGGYRRYSSRGTSKLEIIVKEGSRGVESFVEHKIESVITEVEEFAGSVSTMTERIEQNFSEQLTPQKGPTFLKVCRMRDGSLTAVLRAPGYKTTQTRTVWHSPPIEGLPNPDVDPDYMPYEVEQTHVVIPIEGRAGANTSSGKSVVLNVNAGDPDNYVRARIVYSWDLGGPGIPPLPPGILPPVPPVGIPDALLPSPTREELHELELEARGWASHYGLKSFGYGLLGISCMLLWEFPPAAITACGIVAAAGGSVNAIVAVEWDRYANEYDQEQYNYKSLPEAGQPRRLVLPPLQGLSPTAANALNAVFSNQTEEVELTKALRDAIARYVGAVAAKDAEWERRQLAAAREYAARLADLLAANQDLRARAVSALQASGFPDITIAPSEVERVRSEVLLNGLPPNFAAALTQFGADSETIERLEFDIMTSPPGDRSISLRGFLTDTERTAAEQKMVDALRKFARH